jgi:hypothetical protein
LVSPTLASLLVAPRLSALLVVNSPPQDHQASRPYS